MSRTFLLQDWTTVRSALTQPFVQDSDDWLDLDGFSDVTCWIDIAEVTVPPVGAGVNCLGLQVQTSPSCDDAYFAPIAPPVYIGGTSPFTLASNVPSILRSAKSTVSNNLMRFLRWSITPFGNGTWDLTFRIRAVAARSATFVPPQIAGCIAWFRADLGLTLSGASVTNWNDQSGTNDSNKNLTATGTPTITPIDVNYMNQPTIAFNGSGQYFTSGSWAVSVAQPTTWIIVGHRTSTAAQMDAIDGATAGFGQLVGGAVGNVTTIFAGSSVSTPSNPAYAWTSPSVVLAHFNDPFNSTIYVNDFKNFAGISPAGGAGFDALCVGSHNPAFTANAFWNGTIAEVIGYSGVFSSASQAQLRNYFRGRYGLVIG